MLTGGLRSKASGVQVNQKVLYEYQSKANTKQYCSLA